MRSFPKCQPFYMVHTYHFIGSQRVAIVCVHNLLVNHGSLNLLHIDILCIIFFYVNLITLTFLYRYFLITY